MPTLSTIEYVNNMYGFGGSSSNISKFYLFMLTLTLTDGTIKVFTKIENKARTNLIDTFDMINYNMIKSFKLKILTLPDKNIKLEIQKEFINTQNNFKINDNIINIEFTKNHMNYTYCYCKFIDNSHKKMLSFSPI
jgi:hypothetical protein